VDTLIGFEVADVNTRKVIHRVEAEVPAEMLRKASRSHGIGLRPDQKELWMCDVYHDRTYVFDLTVDPPKQTETLIMKGGGYWMCFSPDGRLCYISERIGDSVAVIDTATKKTIARIPVGKAPKRVLVIAPPIPPGRVRTDHRGPLPRRRQPVLFHEHEPVLGPLDLPDRDQSVAVGVDPVVPGDRVVLRKRPGMAAGTIVDLTDSIWSTCP
jgi:YVTN family beta-propeller protein